MHYLALLLTLETDGAPRRGAADGRGGAAEGDDVHAGGRAAALAGSFGSVRVHARCLVRSDLAGLAFAGATA